MLADLLGVLGFVLGVINTVLYYRESVVRLAFEVTSIRGFTVTGTFNSENDLFVKIANLSAFDVYINSVGFCPAKSAFLSSPKDLTAVPGTYWSDKYNENREIAFPLKLHSREAITLSLSGKYNELTGILRKNSYMFVRTDCGYFKAKEIPRFIFAKLL